MSILVIAEHDNNSLKGATLNTVAAAVKLEKEITLLVAGSECSSVVLKLNQLILYLKLLAVDDAYIKTLLQKMYQL